MMNIVTIIVLASFLIIGMRIRYDSVKEAYTNWNYYCGRYSTFVTINYSYEERPPYLLDLNEAKPLDFFIVYLSLWKFNPDKYFSYKIYYEDIYELYISKSY